MSYPQPDGALSIYEGQNVFRLLTTIQSNGDIYESDISARGFCIGPQSDIAKAAVTYRDPSAPDLISTIEVGVDKPATFAPPVRMTDKYPTGQPARFLISIADLMYPSTSYTPPGFSAGQTKVFVPPVLDLLQYIGEAPGIPPKRNDKTYRFQNNPNPTQGFHLLVPFFGRKSFYFTLINNDTGGTNAVIDINGINFSNYIGAMASVTPGIGHQYTAIASGTTVAAGAQTEIALPTSSGIQGRYFDYLNIEISPSGGAAFFVTGGIAFTLTVKD